MSEREKQIEEIKDQIKILKQEIYNKQTLLNSLLNMLDENQEESEEE